MKTKKLFILLFILSGCVSTPKEIVVSDREFEKQMQEENLKRVAKACRRSGGYLYRENRYSSWTCNRGEVKIPNSYYYD